MATKHLGRRKPLLDPLSAHCVRHFMCHQSWKSKKVRAGNKTIKMIWIIIIDAYMHRNMQIVCYFVNCTSNLAPFRLLVGFESWYSFLPLFDLFFWTLPQWKSIHPLLFVVVASFTCFNTQYMLLLLTSNAFLFASIHFCACVCVYVCEVFLVCIENSLYKSLLLRLTIAINTRTLTNTHTHIGWLAHRYPVLSLFPSPLSSSWISLWRNLRVHFQDDTSQLNKVQEWTAPNGKIYRERESEQSIKQMNLSTMFVYIHIWNFS